MRDLIRWVDIPPVWLLAFLALAYTIGNLGPGSLSLGPVFGDFLGGILVGAGLLLMALAFYEMRRWKTTVIPHREADHLVTTGIFSRSRNPIYLGDALILFGMILRWDAVLALPLVPVFVWVIEKRFIDAEEARLRRRFKADFARYSTKTRRWL